MARHEQADSGTGRLASHRSGAVEQFEDVRGILFGDPGNLGRYLGVGLIIAGVATLKLAH